MKAPLDESRWNVLDQCSSTNSLASDLVQSGRFEQTDVIVADHQTAGRGRFDRSWISPPGGSLAATWIATPYADHRQPWLIGMSLAAAAAGALHCQLQWPNDLILEGRKLGGVLTEVVADPQGRRIPLVGIGVNLNVESFPAEIAGIAISLSGHHHGRYEPNVVLRSLLERLALLPEPDSWESLRPIWALFDATPGKKFRLPSGEIATGIGIGPEAELLCSVDGEARSVMAADAILGA